MAVFTILLALLTLSFTGCQDYSSPSSGDSLQKETTEQKAVRFMADFPPYEDKKNIPTYSHINIIHRNVPKAEALAFADSMKNKDFDLKVAHYNGGAYYDYIFKDAPNKDFSFIDVDISFKKEHSTIYFVLQSSIDNITFADFERIFGSVDSDISEVYFENVYDRKADMGKEFAAHYKKLVDSGLFDASDCDTDGVKYWLCSKDDGTYKYKWLGAYDIGYYAHTNWDKISY
jgi:hypothetical protein